MLSRRPLQSISIDEDSEGDLKQSDLKKPSKPPLHLSNANNCNQTKFTVSKGKPKSKPDGSASKLTSDRVRSSGNSTARIPFTIFEDEPQPKKSAAKKSINKPATVAVTPILTGKEHKTRGSSVGGAVQTSVEKKGSLKTPENEGESYWRALAEERRLALEETLKENQMLHQVLDTFKEENEALTRMTAQKEYFEKLVEALLEMERPEIVHLGTQTE